MLRFLTSAELKPFVAAHVSGSFSMRVLPGGLLNQNMLVTAGAKRFLLKGYRTQMDAARVTETHRIMAFASERGIPVPLSLAEDVIANHVVALYPFVIGEHPPRYGNSLARVRVMGAMLGQVHATLDSYRPLGKRPTSEALSRSKDPTVFLKEIADLRQSLGSHPASVRAEVSRHLDMLERVTTEGDWGSGELDKLPVRVCHNDFHSKNILMRRNTIVAVLDWEKAGWQRRGFEITRSVIFNCRLSRGPLDWKLVEAYLHVYKQHTVLSELEIQTAFACGFREFVFSLWALKEYLAGQKVMHGNLARRAVVIPDLAAHRVECAERIANALRK